MEKNLAHRIDAAMAKEDKKANEFDELLKAFSTIIQNVVIDIRVNDRPAGFITMRAATYSEVIEAIEAKTGCKVVEIISTNISRRVVAYAYTGQMLNEVASVLKESLAKQKPETMN